MAHVTPDGIEDALEAIGVAYSRQGPRLWRVDVPAVDRRSVTVGIAADERTLNLTAFVLRAPDRNAEQVYRRMLNKNLDLAATGQWRFALDEHDDVYLVARIDLAQATEPGLDRLLGALSALVDATWIGLMRLGFAVPDPPTGPAGGSTGGSGRERRPS